MRAYTWAGNKIVLSPGVVKPLAKNTALHHMCPKDYGKIALNDIRAQCSVRKFVVGYLPPHHRQ